MRKAYQKPEMFAERFELASHIAACSGYTDGGATHIDALHCAFKLGTQNVFNAGVLDCDLPIDATEDGTDCYNGPFLEVAGNPFASQ